MFICFYEALKRWDAQVHHVLNKLKPDFVLVF